MAKVTTKPTVRLTQKAWQKIWALTEECKIEVSAMGHVATDAQRKEWGIDEKYYVLDIHVIDQECSAASTELDQEGLAELIASLREEGVNPEQVIFWWHSHVNMDTGHSGTDENQIEAFDSDTSLISMITNKRGDVNMRVDVFSPFRYSFESAGYSVDQIPIIDDNWGADMIAEHVTVLKPTPIKVKTTGFGKNSWTANGSSKKKSNGTTRSGYGGYGGYNNYYDDDWSGEWYGDYTPKSLSKTQAKDLDEALQLAHADGKEDEEEAIAVMVAEIEEALNAGHIHPEDAIELMKTTLKGEVDILEIDDLIQEANLKIIQGDDEPDADEGKKDSTLFDDFERANEALVNAK